MNILAVVGAGRKSGKTTTVECLVKELSSRGFNVGTIKQIHEEDFSIDTEGKDTWRHIKAGAKIVVSAAPREVCAIKKIKGNRFKEAVHLLESESMDYIVVEGDPKITMPRILAVRTRKDALGLLKEQEHVICISSLSPDKVKGNDVKKPVINPKENIKKIADLVVKVFKRLVPIAGG
ncbi:MAG: molybdopterin-guanine dinucleotide biosynthesis protein B [Candidatus Hydrothermarchaeales archaeon]